VSPGRAAKPAAREGVARERLDEVRGPAGEVSDGARPQPRARAPRARQDALGDHGAHGIVAEVPAALKTTVTELDGSRVRLDVEVPATEVEGRVERKAHELGRQLKL